MPRALPHPPPHLYRLPRPFRARAHRGAETGRGRALLLAWARQALRSVRPAPTRRSRKSGLGGTVAVLAVVTAGLIALMYATLG